METRFSEVIKVRCPGACAVRMATDIVKVARELGLTRSRHQLADRIHESLWIQKESRIRYAFYSFSATNIADHCAAPWPAFG